MRNFSWLDWAITGAIAIAAVLIGVLWWNVSSLYDEVDAQRERARQAEQIARDVKLRAGAMQAAITLASEQYPKLQHELEQSQKDLKSVTDQKARICAAIKKLLATLDDTVSTEALLTVKTERQAVENTCGW